MASSGATLMSHSLAAKQLSCRSPTSLERAQPRRDRLTGDPAWQLRGWRRLAPSVADVRLQKVYEPDADRCSRIAAGHFAGLRSPESQVQRHTRQRDWADQPAPLSPADRQIQPHITRMSALARIDERAVRGPFSEEVSRASHPTFPRPESGTCPRRWGSAPTGRCANAGRCPAPISARCAPTRHA